MGMGPDYRKSTKNILSTVTQSIRAIVQDKKFSVTSVEHMNQKH